MCSASLPSVVSFGKKNMFVRRASTMSGCAKDKRTNFRRSSLESLPRKKPRSLCKRNRRTRGGGWEGWMWRRKPSTGDKSSTTSNWMGERGLSEARASHHRNGFITGKARTWLLPQASTPTGNLWPNPRKDSLRQEKIVINKDDSERHSLSQGTAKRSEISHLWVECREGQVWWTLAWKKELSQIIECHFFAFSARSDGFMERWDAFELRSRSRASSIKLRPWVAASRDHKMQRETEECF